MFMSNTTQQSDSSLVSTDISRKLDIDGLGPFHRNFTLTTILTQKDHNQSLPSPTPYMKQTSGDQSACPLPLCIYLINFRNNPPPTNHHPKKNAATHLLDVIATEAFCFAARRRKGFLQSIITPPPYPKSCEFFKLTHSQYLQEYSNLAITTPL